jgi:hypothetical protein
VTAIDLAQKAGWPVSPRNGKIIIEAPDGTALTIGARPNEASLNVWRSQCRRYNLVGLGPAMTPAQQEKVRQEAAEEYAQQQAAQKQQAAEAEAVKTRKAAEAALAEKKAQEVVAAASKLPTPPKSPSVPTRPENPATAQKAVSVPVVTFTAPPSPATVAQKVTAKKVEPAKPKGDGYPEFNASMLLVEDYSQYRLTSGPDKGKYFCPNCLERGEKMSYKQPQGLAAHRGFRHGAYRGTADASSTPELPESVKTALDLLRDTLVEELSDTADATELREAKKKIEELNSIVDERAKELTALRAELAKAKTSAEERGKALDEIGKKHEAEIKMLMGKLEKDLQQFVEWGNNLAPVQAVVKILDVAGGYLKK